MEPIDPSTIGSIEHQAEKLGYLIASMEASFQHRAKVAKNETLVDHSKLGIQMMDSYLKGELSLEDYAAKSAELLDITTRRNDETNAHLANAMNQVNKTVQDAVESGKLRYFMETFRGDPN